jgi:hypothetical protein
MTTSTNRRGGAMGALTRRAEDVATVAAFFAGMATETARQLRNEPAPETGTLAAYRQAQTMHRRPGDPALPRWDAPHHCADHAEQAHTWQQSTRFGRAVWLVQQCRVCGEPWDVLSDQSDEGVLVASVYPVWAVAGCQLCTQECRGERCGCPCHRQAIDAPGWPPEVRR